MLISSLVHSRRSVPRCLVRTASRTLDIGLQLPRGERQPTASLSGVSLTLANWLQYSNFRKRSMELHPASVGRKLPASANIYRLPLVGKLPHVGIVGAGISGLRCAEILGQNGAKVTILESRDRIGGRITQSEIGGYPVDLGANWIHGTEHNPIAEISVISGSTTCEWNGQETIIDGTGHPLDEATTIKIAEWMWMTIDEGFEYSTKHKDQIPADMSLFEFCRERVEKTDFAPAEKALCLEFCKLWGAYIGEPVERQSMRFFCLEECIEGTNMFVASTYKRILNHISRSALKDADLHLKEPVVKIEAPDRNLKGDHKIVVTNAHGQTYHFDEVIVTCPLGWLKQNKSIFRPGLTPRLSAAVDNISFGRLEKIYVTFSRVFWHAKPNQPSVIGLEPNSKNDTEVAAADNDFPVAFTQFLEPSYVEHAAEDISWNVHCVSMAALPPSCAHPTLLFYIYGPCAAYVVSKIKDLDESSSEYYNVLNELVHPLYSRLSGYSSSSEDCKPTAFLASKWIADPYAGNGSYTNFQVGLEAGDKDIETMRLGMGPDRGVWFAGEHTAPFVGLGTTTGAYWSGERAAGQICDLYSLGQLGRGVEKDDSLPTGNAGNTPGATMFYRTPQSPTITNAAADV